MRTSPTEHLIVTRLMEVEEEPKLRKVGADAVASRCLSREEAPMT